MYLVEISASLAECLISLYFLIKHFTFKNSKGNVFTVICFVFLVLDNIFLSQSESYELISVIIFTITIFAFAIIILKGKTIEKLLYCLLLSITISLINLLVINLTARLLQLNDVKHLHSGTYLISLRLAVLFTTKFIYFLVVKAILIARKKVNYSLTLSEWLFLIVFFGFSWFICISLWYINRSHENFNITLYIVIVLSLIIINIMLYFLLHKLGKEHIRKTEIALMELKLNSQKQLISEMKIQYDEIRILRHDMKHYVYYPLTLLEDNKNTEAKEYLNKLYCNEIESIIPAIYTGSEIIDAVINSKIAMCTKKGIEIKCETISNSFNHLELDLSIMLSNLFDNAIEASAIMGDDKKILLAIKLKKSYLNITMKNRISASVLLNNPDLKTKKSNKNQHGYGLKSIRDIANKHEGRIDIYEEEEYFVVDILLNFRI